MNPSGLRLEEKKSADEVRSQTSYKSTQSSRSSVLQRAREYNRRIEDQNKRRSKSLERSPDTASSTAGSSTATPRSKSAGRLVQRTTRERALDSVRRDTHRTSFERQQRQPSMDSGIRSSNNSNNNTMQQQQQQRRPSPSNPRQSFTSSAAAGSHRSSPATQQQTPREPSVGTRSARSKDSPSRKSRASRNNEQAEDNPNNIVTPELLVDALSGHEDGLLAIAEKLMEHYDAGYDVMGEAIIDAFADVQKLFQHVVEAAHMEGAAFEASRRESEQQQQSPVPEEPSPAAATPPSGGPTRHDEFIDQDVKDILTNAIRKGTALRDSNRHDACYELYEQACQAASSLLPVDSDHRGRLQLSAARAESMSPDRACAILRYAMDDVLRSGMRAGRTPLPDPSQRADVVLSRPKGHPSLSGVTGQVSGVVQSSDEALASLMEEMKEILSAPVYKDTPLQGVARRFWAALNDAQKTQQKNEERLEQNLAKLKGEFLLARAEWEEKLTQSKDTADNYKEKYQRLKESRSGEGYMDQARSFANRMNESGTSVDEHDMSSMFGSVKSFTTPGKTASVASFGSGLAQQAKTIVTQMNNFNCNNMNDRNGPVVDAELRNGRTPYQSSPSGRSRSRTKSSRNFREYSHSPQRVDV